MEKFAGIPENLKKVVRGYDFNTKPSSEVDNALKSINILRDLWKNGAREYRDLAKIYGPKTNDSVEEMNKQGFIRKDGAILSLSSQMYLPDSTLEKALVKGRHINWGKLENKFDEYVTQRTDSEFTQVIASYTHCKDCARSDKGFTRYMFENGWRKSGSYKGEREYGCFSVPRKLEVDEPVLIVLEVKEVSNNPIEVYGWIKEAPRRTLSKRAWEEFRVSTEKWVEHERKMSTVGRSDENGMFQYMLESMKRDMCKNLMKSKNPERRQKAKEILLSLKKK